MFQVHAKHDKEAISKWLWVAAQAFTFSIVSGGALGAAASPTGGLFLEDVTTEPSTEGL